MMPTRDLFGSSRAIPPAAAAAPRRSPQPARTSPLRSRRLDSTQRGSLPRRTAQCDGATTHEPPTDARDLRVQCSAVNWP